MQHDLVHVKNKDNVDRFQAQGLKMTLLQLLYGA